MNHQISRRTAGLLAFSAPILPLRPAIGAENSLPGFSGRVYPPFLQKYNQVKVEPKGKEDPGFSFAYPKGWVYMLEPPKAYGVLFSTINPDEPGETIAVYSALVENAGPVRSAQEAGEHLAKIAANGELVSQEDVMVEVVDGKPDRRKYSQICVAYGGGTAGRFGSAYELRSITVDEATKRVYFLRATATRSRYIDPALDVKQQLRDAVASFRLLTL